MASREQRIADVVSRIMPAEAATEHVKILVYGRNGAGKTRFAATAPKCLIVDINERGTMSVRDSDASVLHIKRWEEITYLYWYLREGEHDFESVAIDNLTTMQHLCLKHVLKESVDRDPNKDPAMASMREWGKLAELMKPLILNLRNLPMNVIFVAQERQLKDADESEEAERVPDLSPGSRGTAMGAVDIIGHIFRREVRVVDKKAKKETKRWQTLMLVGPHDRYVTKDRTGSLGRLITNPSVSGIINTYQAIGEEDDNG